MLISEVISSQVEQPVDVLKLAALIELLQGRSRDSASPPEINLDAFINLARSNGLPLSRFNVNDVLTQDPISQMVQPMKPNDNTLRFADSDIEQAVTDVATAQDTVNKMAKSALNRDRSV